MNGRWADGAELKKKKKRENEPPRKKKKKRDSSVQLFRDWPNAASARRERERERDGQRRAECVKKS